ncbi:MAG: UDP diphosphate synthase, partial [Candidatus Atribacteria bacterium]
NKLGIKIISIYVDILDTDESLRKEMVLQLTDKLHDVFSRMPNEIGFEIYGEDGEQKKNREGSGLLVYLSIGFGGRSEITKAVKSILSDVISGKLKPDDINENNIESSLLVKHEPDIVIRAGGKHLSDFLIWQSVYSELYFTDVNWHDVRKIEMLRIVRDFQKRQRRFGK